MNRNQWTESNGMGGRNGAEYALNSLMPNTVALMASQHAVIFPGANLFSMYLKMPGRKDARTSEKPV